MKVGAFGIAGLLCLSSWFVPCVVEGRKTRIRGTIDDLDFLVQADGHARVHPRMLQATQDFVPLTCNPTSWTCTPWPHGTSFTGDVEIPCGTCYNMDAFTNGEVVEVTGAVHIKGRLEINDGTKVTLKTTGIIVEGELAMTSLKPVDGTPDIVVELTGTDDVLFIPDSQNSDACGGNFAPCNLGPKPIVVAGGTLDLQGMNDVCPTWFVIEDVVASGKPSPIEYMKRPTLAAGCVETLVNENFEGGLNGWYGNLGGEEDIITGGSHDGSDYLKISKRTLSGAGPMMEIPKSMRDCILADTDYFFSAKIKIEPGPEYAGTTSTCAATQTGCPKLRFSHMQDSDYVRWMDLISIDGVTQVTDGQWFEMKGVISLNPDWINADDVFSLLTINEVEPGIDISIDDVKLTLPPATAFPDPADVCGELIRNGGADLLDGFTFPAYSYMWYKTLGINSENGNPYFTMANREQYYDALAVELTPGCLQAGSIYAFSSRIRVHSPVSVQPKVALKIHNSNGGTDYGILHSACPATSAAIGWTTCTTNFQFNSQHAMAERVELFFIISNSLDDADFDDISLSYVGSSALAGMKLQNGAGMDACYAPGAEVVVTSNDLDYNSAQLGTVSTVHTTGTMEVVETLQHITTKTEAVDYATELAVLSRNILFRPGDADAIGPSLTILHTNATQKIQGVELTGFGAAGVVGRHPINFKLSGDSSGSVVQRNTVRSSNNRCINLHSTNNVDVSDNVSFDNSGHCYAIHNGDEIGNTFTRNIGIGTKLGTVPPGSGETDNQASVFYITNPQNMFTNNVAAGSQGHGFWYDLTSTKSTLSNIGFDDNTAHSTLIGFKTFPWGLQPTAADTWLNTKAYKNRAQGIFFHNSENVILQGGSIADNKIGIEINEADKITLRNIKVQGYTPEYKALVDLESRSAHCGPSALAADNTVVGIRLHANAMLAGSPGSTVENVDFSDFGSSTGCSAASSALQFNSAYTTASYTTTVTMTGLTFDVGASTYNQISLCSVASAGVTNIYMEDTDGSLNPAANGGGMIVSDEPDMAVFASCVPLTGTCAQYCSGVSEADIHQALPQTTPVSSPTAAAPTYTVPNAVSDICLDNDDFELGTDRWFGVKSTLTTTTGFGGTGVAIRATNRDHQARGGVWQRFSPTCLTQGMHYIVRADVKLTDANTENIFWCDPTIKWLNTNSCGAISLLVGTKLLDVAYTVGPYNANGWNEIYGTFQATADMMAETTISLLVARAPNNVDITVDNVAIGMASGNEVGLTSCSAPIVNGDAETGDHRFWFIRGHGSNGLIAMDSGYGGSGYSLKHTGVRPEPRASLTQYMDGSCFTAGSTWDISFVWKVLDSDDNPVACDKATTAAVNSCPSIVFIAGGAQQSDIITNTDTSSMLVGPWNTFTASYTVDAAMTGYPDFWLTLYIPSNFNYMVDNVVLTRTN